MKRRGAIGKPVAPFVYLREIDMRILKLKDSSAPPPAPAGDVRWRLTAPLLKLSNNPADNWTVGDSYEHSLILGSTGGGKSSTSAKILAHAMLLAGYGGIVLCAKPGEADQWEAYARACGRASSVIRFDASGRWRFNFLDYLMGAFS